MSLSTSRMSFEDCYEVMDKALESENGIRVGFDEEGDATFYRMRMNQARTLDRKFNAERYPSDHPMHLRSEYDTLTFRIRRSMGKFWVYAERKALRGVVEEIKDRGEKPEPVRQTISYRRF